MALSLHAEYLLGYLAGAKNLPSRDVIPFARFEPGTRTPQASALVNALALGISDGRRSHAVRDASEVRMRVMAIINPRPAAVASPAAAATEGEPVAPEQRDSDPNISLDALVARIAVGE
jgi:hypothetical protein